MRAAPPHLTLSTEATSEDVWGQQVVGNVRQQPWAVSDVGLRNETRMKRTATVLRTIRGIGAAALFALVPAGGLLALARRVVTLERGTAPSQGIP
jgi:hypothetical protein